MKKTNKKNSTARKLLPAFAMLTVSAISLSSATYAWFTMNKEVKVSNMHVRALAEDGLLINEVITANDANWDDEATAAQTSANASVLYPASTANGSTWYHAASKKSNSAAAASSGTASSDLVSNYDTLSGLVAITGMTETTAVGGSTAARTTYGATATALAGYYVQYTYYLKSSSGSAVPLGANSDDMCIKIKSVDATLPASANSANLDKALRVGIKLNSQFYIYAPVGGYSPSYYVNASSTATAPNSGTTAVATDLDSLPAVGSNGVPVDVYIWYEGEDVNCKSDNALAATLDDIQIDITFGLETVGATVTRTETTETGNKTTLSAVTIPSGATGIKVDNVACADSTAAAAAINAINDTLTTHTLQYTPASS